MTTSTTPDIISSPEVQEQFKQLLKVMLEKADDRPYATPAGGDGESSVEPGATVPLDEELEDTSESLTYAESGGFNRPVEAASATRARRKSFNHRGSDWNPLTSRQGIDRFSFVVPDGYEFTHHEVKELNTTFPHELGVTTAPVKGATGSRSISVQWKLWGQGQVQYQLSAYCIRKGVAAQRIRVVIGTRGWEARAAQLIQQKQPFTLALVSPDAERLWNDIQRFITNPSGAESIALGITIAIVTGVVAVAGFVAIAYVLGLAISQGCDEIKASYTPGDGVVGTLVFEIGCS